MLTRYSILLSPDGAARVKPDWAYRLYSALLSMAPEAFAHEAHQDGVTPVSQFFEFRRGGILWRVSLLGETAEAALAPVLETQDRYFLQNGNLSLRVAERRAERVPDAEALLDRACRGSGSYRLDFLTATAFKSRGQYLNLPTTRLILQSLIKKWNGCFPACPIEDEDGEGMEAMAAGLTCKWFWLRDREYRIKGRPIPGFVGPLVLENHLKGFHRQLAGALLLFSGYAGVGVKTALGMGGVTVRELKSE